MKRFVRLLFFNSLTGLALDSHWLIIQSGLCISEAISLHYFLYAAEIMKIQNQRKIL